VKRSDDELVFWGLVAFVAYKVFTSGGPGQGVSIWPTVPLERFRFPVEGKASFKSTFGLPWGPGRTHQGIDIFAPQGTPVRAVASGVARTAVRPLGGNMVFLNLPDRTSFYYSHLDRFAVSDGAKVKAGDVLGYVGTTGNAVKAGPHLHFEMHPQGGAAADPFPFLSAAAAAELAS